MTSKKSNCLEYINNYLTDLSETYPGISINLEQIGMHFDAIGDGLGIRILNTLETDNLGAFLFHKTSFCILTDENGFAHIQKISDDDAYEILAMFYAVRALSALPSNNKTIIVQLTEQLNNKINRLTML